MGHGAAMDWWSLWATALVSLVASDELRWAGVLGELDDVRAEAFASSQPSLLDRVYAPDSAGAKADAAMIRDYQRRGAHVVGADMVLLSCRVAHTSADRVRLNIIDRLAASRVVWADGATRSLPSDLPTKRVVTLVRTGDGWRIAD